MSNRTTLLSEFADNNSGAITAADSRDLINSVVMPQDLQAGTGITINQSALPTITIAASGTSTIIGSGASAYDNTSIAIGTNAVVGNGCVESIAIGYGANVGTANKAIAIGYNVSATGLNSIAIGASNSVANSVALGGNDGNTYLTLTSSTATVPGLLQLTSLSSLPTAVAGGICFHAGAFYFCSSSTWVALTLP